MVVLNEWSDLQYDIYGDVFKTNVFVFFILFFIKGWGTPAAIWQNNDNYQSNLSN